MKKYLNQRTYHNSSFCFVFAISIRSATSEVWQQNGPYLKCDLLIHETPQARSKAFTFGGNKISQSLLCVSPTVSVRIKKTTSQIDRSPWDQCRDFQCDHRDTVGQSQERRPAAKDSDHRNPARCRHSEVDTSGRPSLLA